MHRIDRIALLIEYEFFIPYIRLDPKTELIEKKANPANAAPMDYMSDHNLSVDDKIGVMNTFLKMDRVNPSYNGRDNCSPFKAEKLVIPYSTRIFDYPIDPNKQKRSFRLDHNRFSTGNAINRMEGYPGNWNQAPADENVQPCATCGGKGRKPPPKADPDIPDIKTLNNCGCRAQRKSNCHCQRSKRSDNLANTWYVVTPKRLFIYKNQLPYMYLGIQCTT